MKKKTSDLIASMIIVGALMTPAAFIYTSDIERAALIFVYAVCVPLFNYFTRDK